MHGRFAFLIALAASSAAWAGPLSDAFTQGAQLGRSGSTQARGSVTADTARSTVPNYTATPPQTGLYPSGGLGGAAGAAIGNCALAPGQGASYADQACNATNFSQNNPGRRPSFTIGPNDPLAVRSKAIANDPQSIAGNLSGTYSTCTSQTVTTADTYETRTCNEYRTLETQTCNKILTVTPYQTPGCSPGEFLTRVSADPCPACLDYLAFDFSCGTDNYLMHAFTILKGTDSVYMDLGSQYVPGALNTTIPQTQGPSQDNGFLCYQTYYSQSCSGTSCTIGAWFYNPCQGTSYYGANTFVMPTTVAFTDSWDNQCTALETRTQ